VNLTQAPRLTRPRLVILADFLATIHGPVVLAGHSYGGVVIGNAARL
jgi:hypothetical protein